MKIENFLISFCGWKALDFINGSQIVSRKVLLDLRIEMTKEATKRMAI